MSFFTRLKSLFEASTNKIDPLSLEDTLIESDFGVNIAQELVRAISKEKNPLEALKSEIERILSPLIEDNIGSLVKRRLSNTHRPYVILLEGVNGSGKTTSIAKLAYLFQKICLTVDIAACDTFRVAATEQLSVWADRLGCRVFKSDSPRDPASVAFDAMSNSQSDVLLIDTAGRIQNNSNLMGELSKIHRVLKKVDEAAPHMTILVLDATSGQNLIEQVNEFGKVHPISGIILNKMDGNAKGGAIVRISQKFNLPIFGVGTGESEKDFEPFSTDNFLKDLTEQN